MKHIRNAYKPMPEACRQALLSTLSSLREEDTHMRSISFRTMKIMVIALVVALMLGAVAMAAERAGIVRMLLGNAQSPALEAIVQLPQSNATADGVTIAIDSLLWDGRELAFSYTVENTQPEQAVVYYIDQIKLWSRDGGASDEAETSILRGRFEDLSMRNLAPDLYLDVAPVSRNPARGGARCNVSGQAAGMVNGMAEFVVLRPKKAFAIVEPQLFVHYTDETYADIQDQRTALENTKNMYIYPFAEMTVEEYKARLESGLSDEVQEIIARLQREGYTIFDGGLELDELRDTMTEAARMEIPFSFDASVAHGLVVEKSAMRLPEAATVLDLRLQVTPIRTFCDLCIYLPDDRSEPSAYALLDLYGLQCRLTDGDGNELQYADMDGMFDEFVGRVVSQTAAQEGYCISYTLDMPGVTEMPETIRLMLETDTALTEEQRAARETLNGVMKFETAVSEFQP